MLKVKIKFEEAEEEVGTMEAVDVEAGTLFMDADGDIHLRTMEGCIMFDTEELTLYSTVEMQDFVLYPWMEHVTEVEGSVKVKVKVKV